MKGTGDMALTGSLTAEITVAMQAQEARNDARTAVDMQHDLYIYMPAIDRSNYDCRC